MVMLTSPPTCTPEEAHSQGPSDHTVARPSAPAPERAPVPMAAPPSDDAPAGAAPLPSDLDVLAEAEYAAISDKHIVNHAQMQTIFSRARTRARRSADRVREPGRAAGEAWRDMPSHSRRRHPLACPPRAAGNKMLINNAVAMFLKLNRLVPERIERALAAADFDELHTAVHSCKGAAGYIAAERLMAIALDVQRASGELAREHKTEAPPRLHAQVRTFLRCLQELFVELEHIEERKPLKGAAPTGASGRAGVTAAAPPPRAVTLGGA